MFYGIVVRIYFAPGEITEGDLPRRQAKLAIAWAELHQEELMANWDLVTNGEEPFRIQPLQ